MSANKTNSTYQIVCDLNSACEFLHKACRADTNASPQNVLTDKEHTMIMKMIVKIGAIARKTSLKTKEN